MQSARFLRRRLAPLDPDEQRRHKWRNLAQSVLLLGGLGLLVALCGWILFGPVGLLGILLVAMVGFAFGPKVSSEMVLRMYKAQPLAARQLPEVFQVLARLSERAGLERMPRLYYVPSAMLNAFAVGRRNDAVIGVTDGLLRTLDLRELTGVLAHEISHIRNNDGRLMSLADLAGRLTRMMSLLGMSLLFLSLPAWLTGSASVPFLLVLLLIFAPHITTLLQLALSRSREFDADLDAAGLTGDPAGLMSALAKLERRQRGIWEQIFLPGRRLPEPSILRSHPPTEQRLARLRSLYGANREETVLARLGLTGAPAAVTTPWTPITRPPRGRLIGFWY
jgi:heat shock protein HtpX